MISVLCYEVTPLSLQRRHMLKELPRNADAGCEGKAFVFVIVSECVAEAVLPLELVAVEVGVEA